MAVWDDILGGTFSQDIGGPIGSLLEGVEDPSVSREEKAHRLAQLTKDDAPAGATPDGSDRRDPQRRYQGTMRQVAFTAALVAMAAKLARADGRISQNEYDGFRKTFGDQLRNSPGSEQVVLRLFNEARFSSLGYEDYANQARDIFGENSAPLNQIMEGLMAVAHADETLHHTEAQMLDRIAVIFGITPETMKRMHLWHSKGKQDGVLAQSPEEPYQILNISRAASAAEIERAKRGIEAANDENSLARAGVPREFQMPKFNRAMADSAAHLLQQQRLRAARGDDGD